MIPKKFITLDRTQDIIDVEREVDEILKLAKKNDLIRDIIQSISLVAESMTVPKYLREK